LGNPGSRFETTPHNVGFWVVDALARRHDVRMKREGENLVGSGRIGNRSVLLIKPQTFMNLSGESAEPLMRMLELRPADLLVVYDDMDLPFGILRLRPRGGPGTHNGMRSLVSALGEDFARLRIGISQASAGSAIDHVLSPFSPDELPLVDELVQRAADAALAWANEGSEVAMNRYNNRA
jgi:PTH1 family peptidyl-tRNA hydrolase